MSSGKNILLLGVSNTGKTVYGAQLFGRIQQGKSRLRSAAAPRDIRALEEALDCLEDGELPQHTTVEQYGEVVFPILDPAEGRVDVVWPDYGGEQLSRVVRDRVVPYEWSARVREASGWLLVVRPGLARQPVDGLSDPSLQVLSGVNSSEIPLEIALPTQVEQVELLQILLDVRGGHRGCRLSCPSLALVLSCFDEMNLEGDSPLEVLRSRLPLLADFVESTWETEAWRAFGLSSLGTSLLPSDRKGRKEFFERGPVRSGYVVLPDGTKDEDLTLPLAWLLGAGTC